VNETPPWRPIDGAEPSIDMTSERPPVPPASSRGQSRVITALALLLLIPALAIMTLPVSTDSRIAGVVDPERALARVVGRTMDLREAVGRAAGWQRWLSMALGLEDPDDVDQALRWYDELAEHSFDPRVDVHIAILESEVGRRASVEQRVAEWTQREEPLPTFARVLAVAYLGEPGPLPAVPPPTLDGWVSEPWFQDHLAIAVGRATADAAATARATERLVRRGNVVLARLELMGAITLAIGVGGLVLAIVVARRLRCDPDGLETGTAQIPPPWSGAEGAAVLIRGGAISIGLVVAVILLLGALGVSDHVTDAWVTLLEVPTGLLIILPTLVLAWRYLFRPIGLPFVDAVGLRILPNRSPRIALVTALIVGVVAAGDVVLGFVAGALGATGHWTEWFDSDLVFGGPVAVLGSLGEAVIVAAVSEELLFRGLLFTTFRRRLPWVVAALLSALAFAALHGYTSHGFASVAWSGLVWAWAYDRSRSLWPVMLGHAFGNLSASAILLLALR
jgi:membrane protease YdiL (CAAX protease family)